MTSHIKRPGEEFSLCGYYDFDNDLESADPECNCAELAEQIKGLTPMEVSLLLLEQGVSWDTFYGNDDEIDYLHGAVGDGVCLAWTIMEQRNELLKVLEAARSALETPGDLTPDEIGWVINDADAAIANARGEV